MKDPFDYTRLLCNPEDQKELKHEYEKLLCRHLHMSSTSELRLEMLAEWEATAGRVSPPKRFSSEFWTNRGNEADSEKEYHKALVRYHVAANLGSVDAMLALGYAYSNGLGTERNLGERYRWYRMAAGKSGIAMRSMGLTFRDGMGFPVDHKLAAEWFQKGVIAGDTSSMYMLGQSYHEGFGVPKDPGHAVALWTQAADDPHEPDEDAADELAQLYFQGIGGVVEKDVPKALKYAQIADRFWKPRSTLILGKIAAQEGRPKYAFAKFREAACCRRKDERPDEAIYLTGLAYLKGIGTQSDECKALRYWRQVPDLAQAKQAETFALLQQKDKPDQDDSCSELSEDDDDDPEGEAQQQDHQDDPEQKVFSGDDDDDDHGGPDAKWEGPSF